MFIREYAIRLREGPALKSQDSFENMKSMESSPLKTLGGNIKGAPIQSIIINEYENNKLLKSYEYYNPSNSKAASIHPEDDLVIYDNGITSGAEMYNLVKSMEMAVIRGEEAPKSIMWRVNSVMLPDYWYRDNIYKGIFDALACDIHYEANVGYKSFLGIWFGFIRVKENQRSPNLIWRFNSIYMHSTISKKKKIFGSNSFKDSDFERLAPFVGFKGGKNFMKTADKSDDEAIAKVLELKPCEHTSIFGLCSDAKNGIFI
jgi:hypothetical protein